MKFAMAMVALEQGKKVRITEWSDGHYIVLDSKKEIVDQKNYPLHLGNTCSRYEWEIYSEKVRLNSLNEGDSFIYNNKSYTVLPDYLRKHCGTMCVGSIPVMSDTKLFTNLVGTLEVKKV